jgi:diaminohydroxyphosphoribosylaminopyrimidine deaminase/5-amino-6-(5-phosphoribosylamino)uracil reductase
LRSEADAVLTGYGTLLADDPQLTVRLARGKNPLRIVVDSRLDTPLAAQLFNDIATAPLLIATTSDDPRKTALLQERGAEVLRCKASAGGIDLDDLLASLGRRGVQSVLLEAGERLCGEMHRQGLIDRFLIFIAPKFVGGAGKGLFAGAGARLMQDAAPLSIRRVSRVGGDILVEAFPEG